MVDKSVIISRLEQINKYLRGRGVFPELVTLPHSP